MFDLFEFPIDLIRKISIDAAKMNDRDLKNKPFKSYDEMKAFVIKHDMIQTVFLDGHSCSITFKCYKAAKEETAQNDKIKGKKIMGIDPGDRFIITD